MPMPPERPLDALGLARSGGMIEREFSIARFERLRDWLAESEGTARVRAQFSHAGGWPAAHLFVAADVVLVCQRCLGPVRMRVESSSQLVFAEEGASELPEGFETIGGDPRKLDLATLVEDELLLSLPIVPQHDAGEACVAPGEEAGKDGDAPAPGMRRPFAGLKDLLKH